MVDFRVTGEELIDRNVTSENESDSFERQAIVQVPSEWLGEQVKVVRVSDEETRSHDHEPEIVSTRIETDTYNDSQDVIEDIDINDVVEEDIEGEWVGVDDVDDVYDVDSTRSTEHESNRSKILTIIDEFDSGPANSPDDPNGVLIDEVVKEATNQGMNVEDAEVLIEKLRRSGHIYEPSDNRLRIT